MAKRHRLVVEFESKQDLLDFADEVARCLGVPSAVRRNGYRALSTEPYGLAVTNSVSGSTSGTVIQTGGNIVGGVNFG